MVHLGAAESAPVLLHHSLLPPRDAKQPCKDHVLKNATYKAGLSSGGKPDRDDGPPKAPKPAYSSEYPAKMDPHNAEDARLLQLCRSAFHAEHQRLFADAQRMHREAVAGLTKLVDDARWLDRERKRVARKQIKFHSARVQILTPIIDGRKPGLDVVLPTTLSLHESLAVVAPNGRLPIERCVWAPQ